nr:MAG TPA: HC2 Putative zinc-finger [Caudoviricetes sp.]
MAGFFISIPQSMLLIIVQQQTSHLAHCSPCCRQC